MAHVSKSDLVEAVYIIHGRGADAGLDSITVRADMLRAENGFFWFFQGGRRVAIVNQECVSFVGVLTPDEYEAEKESHRKMCQELQESWGKHGPGATDLEPIHVHINREP